MVVALLLVDLRYYRSIDDCGRKVSVGFVENLVDFSSKASRDEELAKIFLQKNNSSRNKALIIDILPSYLYLTGIRNETQDILVVNLMRCCGII
jgi:hypothetical protein